MVPVFSKHLNIPVYMYSIVINSTNINNAKAQLPFLFQGFTDREEYQYVNNMSTYNNRCKKVSKMIEKAEFRRLSSQRWLIVIEGFLSGRGIYVENTMIWRCKAVVCVRFASSSIGLVGQVWATDTI